jgi:Fe-S-cluster containining protein
MARRRRMSLPELPVLPADDPCRGCGACCLHVGWPPFVHYGGGSGEWERLKRVRPELAEEIDRVIEEASIYGEEGPCIWFDPASRRCRHYELRPKACRDFEPGEEDCRRFRAEHGIDSDFPPARKRGVPRRGRT